MELLLREGDYVPDGKGGVCRAQGEEELLQRVLFKLTARREAFPLLPGLGSALYTLPREKLSDWESLARQYAAQALEDEAGLAVRSVTVTPRDQGGAHVAVTREGESGLIQAEVVV